MPHPLTQDQIDEAYEVFCHWQASAPTEREATRREFTDFDDWLESRTHWSFGPAVRELSIASAAESRWMGSAAA